MNRTPPSALAHPLCETASLVSLAGLFTFLALTMACGSDDSETESRAAEDAVAGRFGDDDTNDDDTHDDDTNGDTNDNVSNDDTHNDAPPNDGSEDNTTDDESPVVDDTPSPPTYSEWLASVMTQEQVLKCTINGATTYLDLLPDGQALVSGDIVDAGTWAQNGEVLTLTFAEFLESSDPAKTYVLGDRLLTLETPSLSCDLYRVPGLNVLAGLFAHCDYEHFSEHWFTFNEDGKLKEYEEFNIQVDTLMYTRFGASFFVGDTLVLWFPHHDTRPIRTANVYSDGIEVLDDGGNVERTCFFE